MFVQLFLLNQNNPTAVWLLIYTPCGAENFGGGKNNTSHFGGLMDTAVSLALCLLLSLWLISLLIGFLTPPCFSYTFSLSFCSSVSFFSIFLSLSQAKQRLIPLVSNRDNHGNRPQLLSFGSVGQRHWSGWNSVMWKHKTHNWQMCTHVCVFVLGQKKKIL